MVELRPTKKVQTVFMIVFLSPAKKRVSMRSRFSSYLESLDALLNIPDICKETEKDEWMDGSN
jgi:hypothetical protein